jgi:NADH:ubiquinone oxidoreductase subunit F (NADH-binding)/(2Fe-2S) ferredoxin/NAD-dependent dihydropyrimidine dehydrogenase PreA subunit
MSRVNSAAEVEQLRREILSKREPNKPCVSICAGTGCLALGADKVIASFKEEIKKEGLDDKVDIRETGCPGFCEKGTIVVIYPEGIYYVQVKPGDVPEIVSQTLIRNKVVDRLLFTDPTNGEKMVHEDEIAFYKNQRRLIIGNNIKIDPKSIDDYIAIGGYSALPKALFEMSPEQVIEEVEESNLRGRGGAGFPTGKKWEETRNAPGDIKYVIVNADEGDPGAFMDRAVLEGNPHSVLEGLIIGAYGIGSHEGFVYIREEYPLAVENLRIAIEQAQEYGFLGKNVLGSGFDFNVSVHRGAGAFVSGESSALMTALEGKMGEPRPKYIHMSEKGLWDRPSNLNNVETWANIPLIINNGANWYTEIGTERSKGTKIFSLVGKVNNTGLVEVPMGISLKDIVYKIGGGIPKGKKFKAVQTGGPSGGCIPEELLDTPIDFDELTKLGSIMGSGGIIVMDEDTCMVDLARYYIDFLADESCGKCVPCREGLKQMLRILNRITQGEGREGDTELLEELSGLIVDSSLCALGRTAPNPVLSTIRYFRDEYEAHIRNKSCPAKVCTPLMSYYINPEKCKACMICLHNCPVGAIIGGKNLIHYIDQQKCIKCGICEDVCPSRFNAVKKIAGRVVPEPLPEEKRVIARGKGGKS